MRALYFQETGSLDRLQIAERPRPVPGADEVLVQVRAAAINPSDPKNVLGKMPQGRPPRIPGRDFSGVVVAGPAPWLGKEVLGTGGALGFGRDGTHAEFAAIPLAALVEKPQALGFEAAAALGVSYLTAWSALVTAGGLAPADTVLILGAAGSVGSSAAKIARHMGAARIIGTLRSATERARGLGVPVDDWLVLESQPLPQGLLELTGGRGVDLLLDVAGGDGFEAAGRCLAHRGRHVVIASSPPQVSFNLVEFYHREARLIGVDTLKLSYAESAAILGRVVPLVVEGVLTVPELDAIALEQAIPAYASILAGTVRRKQVIRFSA